VTESGWLKSRDPEAMLAGLRGRAGDRKLRLFLCACCRRVWPQLGDARSYRAVEVAERFADRLADEGERHAAWATARAVAERSGRAAAWAAAEAVTRDAATAARDGSRRARQVEAEKVSLPWWSAEISGRAERRARWHHSALLRDIVGNPFRSVAVRPEWLAWNGGTLVSIAATVYAERAFEHLPVLADALEDAGCDDADILTHCRSEGPHARGCWVLDLLLGKG
jgi:hypothetical protein